MIRAGLKLLVLAVLAISVSRVGGVAYAGDPHVCALYANAAMFQLRQAEANNCGLAGPAWTPDYTAHFNWCIAAPNEAAAAERAARAQAIQACTGRVMLAGEFERCNTYALIAVAQNEANLQAQCTFAGARWQSDFTAHFNFCMSAGRTVAENETLARLAQLATCTP